MGIFETNIMNLFIVFIIIVTLIGERIKSILDQRKEKIKNILQTIDKEINVAKVSWLKTKKIIEIASLYSGITYTRSIKLTWKFNIRRHKQLKNNIFLFQRKTKQLIKSERLEKLKIAIKSVFYLRLKKT